MLRTKAIHKLPVFVLCCGMLAHAQTLAEILPAGVRIEVRQGNGWRRASVSEDHGPGSATIKVRLDPNNEFNVVPRASIRLAPRPATIQVGDRLEWNGFSVTSFQYVPATVKGIGTDAQAGMYLMAWDKYPNSPTYTKKDQLWLLPDAAPKAVETGPSLGKFSCFVYSAKGVPSLLGTLEFRSGGAYVENGKPGTYTFDAASHSITWTSGPAKDQAWTGTLEGNGAVRIRSNVLCTAN